MQKFKNIFLILCSYMLALMILPIVLLPIIVLLLLPAAQRFNSKALFFCLDIFYKVTIKVLLVPVKIMGKENMPKEPAIIVANHESILDAPLVGMICDGYPQMWFSLTQYANKPILGFFLRRLGVPLDTSEAGTAAAGLLRAIRLVKDYDRHTIIFPEGGRYVDGTIHPFLRGFVLIAKTTGRPVVPVFLVNAGKVLPPHTFLIHRYPLAIIIGPAFLYQADESEDAFLERVYNWFIQQQVRTL